MLTPEFRTLGQKYPQYRAAESFNPIREYNYDEEELLADLDKTTEVEKLRQQNFKLHRVCNFMWNVCILKYVYIIT